MASIQVIKPDPREAVMFAQEMHDEGCVLTSITLDFSAPVKGVVVYETKAQNGALTPTQRLANIAKITTAAASLNSNDAGGANSK